MKILCDKIEIVVKAIPRYDGYAADKEGNIYSCWTHRHNKKSWHRMKIATPKSARGYGMVMLAGAVGT